MEKESAACNILLSKLSELSDIITVNESDLEYKFQKCLEIVKKVMNFDLSILYRVTNKIDELLILEVVKKYDPDNYRKDLSPGKKIPLNLKKPNPEYVNEIAAFNKESISSINVPGIGSDMIGYIYLPEDIGGSLLFGGDYIGDVGAVTTSELDAFHVMCNLLSSLLIRSHYRELATHDGLTGLFNSRYIRQELENAFLRYKRENTRKVCIVLGDIDHFKKINDSYGHIQGDVILKEVAGLIEVNTRKGFDTVGRYGGEEFLIIMDGTNINDAQKIVDRWRKKISETNFTKTNEEGEAIPGEHLTLTMSFGLAQLDDSIDNHKEILNNADKALYQAKESGRNQVKVFKE